MGMIRSCSPGAALAAMLFVATQPFLAQAQVEFVGVGAGLVGLVLAASIITYGSLPLWICAITYGSIGIGVARQWPNPHCCCYEMSKSDFPSNGCCDCVSLVTSCIILLVFQSVMFLLHIVFMALAYSPLSVVAMLLDLLALALLIAAIMMLKKAYKTYGEPIMHHAGNVVVVQNAPVAPPVPQVAMGIAVEK